MNARHIVVVLIALFAALGFGLGYLAARGIPEPKAMQLGSTLLISVLTFAWFWFDSEARAYRRSPFLSVAIVALGALAVPYYLLRSRPKGQRLKAIGGFVGSLVLMVAAMLVASLPGSLLGG